ncbi:interferon-induced protein 44-like isoform X2 [Salmo trutta]|uniref:interferon-induced protein 44-like isoform X2 n=1 Tax=Salmo trutta TaxID=8032 RepID=UPI0011310F8E|nr:interferon-induced protein 44-like isoform X2 [Salmo trutta]
MQQQSLFHNYISISVSGEGSSNNSRVMKKAHHQRRNLTAHGGIKSGTISNLHCNSSTDSKQERDTMVAALRNFKLSDPDMGQLRCLLYGPVGAGKSSFINSVNNVFQGRVAHNALAAAASGTSFTKTYNRNYNKDGDKRLLFAFNDVMGLEAQEKGMQPEDIINALEGHLVTS